MFFKSIHVCCLSAAIIQNIFLILFYYLSCSFVYSLLICLINLDVYYVLIQYAYYCSSVSCSIFWTFIYLYLHFYILFIYICVSTFLLLFLFVCFWESGTWVFLYHNRFIHEYSFVKTVILLISKCVFLCLCVFFFLSFPSCCWSFLFCFSFLYFCLSVSLGMLWQ